MPSSAATSAAGQTARTLLDRFDGAADLDALASSSALKILEALVAPSRKKLAQRVRQELQRSQLAEIDEQVVIALLREEGLFAELETQSLSQLQGATGVRSTA